MKFLIPPPPGNNEELLQWADSTTKLLNQLATELSTVIDVLNYHVPRKGSEK